MMQTFTKWIYQRRLILFLMVFFLSVYAKAQEMTVTGTVTSDEDNTTLPGVSINIKGTTRGTVTDLDGHYSINVPSSDATLIFSFVGYVSEEVQVGNRSEIDITMAPDVTSLQEVVVIGYGTVKKSDITGSVASVKNEEITAYPTYSAQQALQGRVAGVMVQANNGGEPGAAVKVRVRGGTSINADSDPIYVVDGFVGAEMPPPEDIASIEVLKDASATAIYGSRGANGVIMVTTKRGKEGKAKINLSTSYSLQNPINQLDLLNADQFADYIAEVNPGYVPGDADTDWQDEIFRQGYIENTQLSVSGGKEDIRYYLSGTYFDQKGIVEGSNYKRYSVNSNLDVDATDKLHVGINLYARRSNNDGLRTQENTGGAGAAGVISAAYRFNPDYGIYNDDGTYTISGVGDDIDNPYATATEVTDQSVTDRFQTNVKASYDILKDLKFTTTLGLGISNGRSGSYYPTTVIRGAGVGGEAYMSSYKNTLTLSENYFTYNKSLGASDLSAVVGYSYQKSRNEGMNARSTSFVTNSGLYWNLGGGANYLQPDSYVNEWELASYYGRAQLSVLDKYMFTLTGRYDGSSTFSENHKWSFFPSGAFAWDMKGEPFLENVNVLNQWKWRVSYGLTGNRAINSYGTLARFSEIYTIQGGSVVNAVAVTELANDELKWETTSQLNIGADIGFFKGRLNLTVDAYKMVTKDLLFQVPLPEYIGLRNPVQVQNAGSLENKGLEVALNTVNTTGALGWKTTFNFSMNRNKVLELPEGQDIFRSSAPGHFLLSDTQILREGEPVGSFYGYVYDGVYQEGDEIIPGSGFETTPGGEKYRDINGVDENGDLTGEPDGKLNGNDRTIIGNPNPDYIWAMNNEFTYKNFDLGIFFQASHGNDMLSYTLMELDVLTGANNATTAALDRWTPTHTDTNVPKAGSRSKRVSTRWVYDASYVRLKNVVLGYNLPKPLLERLKLSKFRLYVSAQNLFTITDYPGLDPEVNYATNNNNASSNLNLGLDYGSYPNVKSYTFGLNIGF